MQQGFLNEKLRGTDIRSKKFLFGFTLRTVSGLAPDLLSFYSIVIIFSIFVNSLSSYLSCYLRYFISASRLFYESMLLPMRLLSCSPMRESSSEMSGIMIPSLSSVARVSIDFFRLVALLLFAKFCISTSPSAPFL